MKTIFIFDDSRVTDPDYFALALSEEGEALALMKFDDWTRPHMRFVMCVDSSCSASALTADIVNCDRFRVRTAYDKTFGPGNWIAVWIESPKQDPRCLDALRAMNNRRALAAEKRTAALVAGLLSALVPAAESQPHTTH
jgi:hypothetical protein